MSREKDARASRSRRAAANVETLVGRLRSRDGMVRQRARGALKAMGKGAVPHLIPLLVDPDDQVRWEAAKALADSPDPRAAPALVAALEDRGYGVRWLAAVGLIGIGPSALPPLLQALTGRSDSVWVREGAHHVLRDLAKGDSNLRDLVSAVLAGLEGVDPQDAVVGAAYEALDRIKRLPKRRT